MLIVKMLFGIKHVVIKVKEKKMGLLVKGNVKKQDLAPIVFNRIYKVWKVKNSRYQDRQTVEQAGGHGGIRTNK